MTEPYTLPAEGKDVYRNFVTPIPLLAPRYVKAVEFRPGNSKIVHHAFILFDRTRESREWDKREAEPGFSGIHAPSTAQPPTGHFLSWQPGKRVSREPDGLPWRLETNTDLVLQLHLKPTGKPEQIQSSVGFYFTDRPPTNTPIKIWLVSYDIDILINRIRIIIPPLILSWKLNGPFDHDLVSVEINESRYLFFSLV